MNPVIDYETRRDSWRQEHQSQERLFIQIGNWRLIVGILEALLAWLAFGQRLISGWFLLIPLAAFIPLIIWHVRVIRRRIAADRAVKFYETRLARVHGHWMGTGPTGDEFRSPDHVYADDLDIFGKGSLFELASTCRIAAGEKTLADWFLQQASIEEASSRQHAVQELSSRLELREHIALLGEDIRAELHVEVLERWGSMPPIPFSAGSRWLALLLAIAGIVTLIATLSGKWPWWLFAAIFLCEVLFAWVCRKHVSQVTGTIEAPSQALRLLSLILAQLERQHFSSPYLHELRRKLHVAGLAASKRIAHLHYWLDWLNSSDHLLVRIIAPVLLWREQLSMGVEAWRRNAGPHIGKWIRAVAEFEALSSLAALKFEHPQWVFPELAPEGASLEATALRHPLLPSATCVPNDVALNSNRRLLIVSGSNMSGKSTLLRAIGLNAVLAWAGAPVAAKWLRISPLQPSACTRVTDSLQDNKSRFLAEIMRLRQIIDLTQRDLPVLFLLDELLSGTNSHDRRIGAAGVVRRLIESGAIGLITTHDLALAEIEQDIGPTAANAHFEDHIEDGRIEFDYRLLPGIVRRSNALQLMHSIGLNV